MLESEVGSLDKAFFFFSASRGQGYLGNCFHYSKTRLLVQEENGRCVLDVRVSPAHPPLLPRAGSRPEPTEEAPLLLPAVIWLCCPPHRINMLRPLLLASSIL